MCVDPSGRAQEIESQTVLRVLIHARGNREIQRQQ